MSVKSNVTSLLLVLMFLSSCNSFKSVPTARSPGRIIDDGFIQRIAHRQIRRLEPKINAGNISVHSFNRTVLLTGQVENSALATLVESAIFKSASSSIFTMKLRKAVRQASPFALAMR